MESRNPRKVAAAKNLKVLILGRLRSSKQMQIIGYVLERTSRDHPSRRHRCGISRIDMTRNTARSKIKIHPVDIFLSLLSRACAFWPPAWGGHPDLRRPVKKLFRSSDPPSRSARRINYRAFLCHALLFRPRFSVELRTSWIWSSYVTRRTRRCSAQALDFGVWRIVGIRFHNVFSYSFDLSVGRCYGAVHALKGLCPKPRPSLVMAGAVGVFTSLFVRLSSRSPGHRRIASAELSGLITSGSYCMTLRRNLSPFVKNMYTELAKGSAA
jgi:hypothetical protein